MNHPDGHQFGEVVHLPFYGNHGRGEALQGARNCVVFADPHVGCPNADPGVRSGLAKPPCSGMSFADAQPRIVGDWVILSADP